MEPFNLAWGSSIFARISALNIVGSSSLSTAGNGAIIVTIPDAPVNLVDDAEQTTATQIGIDWSEGPNNGGSPVIDY